MSSKRIISNNPKAMNQPVVQQIVLAKTTEKKILGRKELGAFLPTPPESSVISVDVTSTQPKFEGQEVVTTKERINVRVVFGIKGFSNILQRLLSSGIEYLDQVPKDAKELEKILSHQQIRKVMERIIDWETYEE